MKTKALLVSITCLFVVFFSKAWAFEIITEEDIRKEIILTEDLIKTADNAVFMFDSSSSMKKLYKDTGMSRYDVAKKKLMEQNEYFPDLGHNFGFYLYTPWKEVLPMQKYNREKFAKALESLPEVPTGATLLVQGLKRLEGVLKPLKGKTAVFLYTDGGNSSLQGAGMRSAADIAHSLAKKYDVCFYIISTNDDFYSAEIFERAEKFNFCSRAIGFETFIEHPEYNSEALFTVVAKKNIVTVMDQKIVGIKTNDILFSSDRAVSPQEMETGLNILATYLKANESSFVVLAGHADSAGAEEYNLFLSRGRAQLVAYYLKKHHGINPARIQTFWYGEINPIADNATEEGRMLNRRVEVFVGQY